MKLFFSIFLILVSSCKPEVSTQSSGLKLLDYTTIETSAKLQNIPFGGLSGMVSIENDTYMAISDDRSEFAPARMIKLKINFKDNKLVVVPIENIFLTENGENYKLNEIDAEAITRLNDDFIIASEGSYREDSLRAAPSLKVYNAAGIFKKSIVLNQSRYVPEDKGKMTKGVRPNLGFESLSSSPSGVYLFSVSESALRQDASEDFLENNIVRLMRINLQNQQSEEYAIKVDNIFEGSDNGNNGISDILAISDEEVLILERAWLSNVKKQVIRIYKVKLNSKALVTNIEKLTLSVSTLEKTKIYDFADSEHAPDNLEVLCFGPTVNGHQTLIVASDNNFSKYQKNQFYLFEILSL